MVMRSVGLLNEDKKRRLVVKGESYKDTEEQKAFINSALDTCKEIVGASVSMFAQELLQVLRRDLMYNVHNIDDGGLGCMDQTQHSMSSYFGNSYCDLQTFPKVRNISTPVSNEIIF